jgi:LruC domain-containing protein/uncharacterized repeat protein (TIGR01451 family)
MNGHYWMSTANNTLTRHLAIKSRCLLVVLLGLLCGPLAYAAPQLQLTLTSSVSTVAAGTKFDYTIQYKCASITENCLAATVTDVLPAALSGAATDVTMVGSAHTTAAAYTAATRTAKWTFVNPLPAGSTGQLTMTVLFPTGGVTPNGTTAVNTASMSATGATTATSNPVTVTATAISAWTIAKTRLSGGTGAALDQEVVYQIQTCPNTSQLHLNTAVLTDTLPAGAVFVSASNGGTHANGVVTWTTWGTGANINNLLISGGCVTRTLTAIYPSGMFTTGTNVVNAARMTGTVKNVSGEVAITPLTSNLTHSIIAGAAARTFTKKSDTSAPTVGQTVTQYFDTANTGNVALTNFVIDDVIPSAMNVTQIRSGTIGNNVAPTLTVEYQTSANTNWTTVTGYPRALTGTAYNVTVSSMNLGVGVYITRLRYTYASLPTAFKVSGSTASPGFQAAVLTNDRSGALIGPGSVITNVGAFSYSYNGVNTTGSSTVTMTVPQPAAQGATVTDANPIPKLDKAVIGTSAVLPDNQVTYELTLNNGSAAGSALSKPILGDLLAAGLDYVANSATVSTRPTGMPNPVVEALTNYNNTGRTLLRIRWDGASAYDLPVNTTAKVRFNVKVKAGTLPGSVTNIAHLIGYANAAITTSSCYTPMPADTNDLNGNGNKTETLCPSKSGTGSFTVNTTAAMESVKWVKGQLDADYVKFPSNGTTVAGGSLLYRLQVINVGNVPMKNAQIIDVLPYVGDTGVLDPQDRLSAWRPNLIAPVVAPTGVVVYYSTQSNPCRTELGYSPDGCTDPAWSVTPPADITTVQALKFDFGSIVVNPQDKLELTWPMRAPIGAPTKGEIAWNSFGYVATRADNLVALLPSEPIRVGMAIQPPSPPAYGNFVWLDNNDNGIQDSGEPGLNGVRVDFFKADGTLVDSTLTTSDGKGNPGFYQFTNMQPGSYYAKFYPPAGYAITQPNAGSNDTLDSDADPSLSTTPVITLDWGQIDYSWAMGLKLSSTGAAGNYVWYDRNGNGIQDEATNDGINGVTVKAYAASNPSTVAGSAVTANDVNGNPGYYRLDGLVPGTYVLEFSLPTGATFTALNAANSTAQTGSDANTSTGRTASFTLTAGQYDASWDAGIILPTGSASLGDRVWLDGNNNGLYEPFDGEQGFDGIRVNLYLDTDSNGQFTPGVDQYYTTTSTYTAGGYSGYYAFTALPAGNYIAQIDAMEFQQGKPLAGLLASSSVANPANGIDNDNNGYLLAGYGMVSKAVTLDTQADTSLDFGLTATYSLGNRVFKDDGTGGGLANDGIQNGAEPGIAGVAVNVYAADSAGNPTGTAVATQATDADGYYRFDNLTAGSYVVVVDKLASKALKGLDSSTGNSTDFTVATDLRDHGKDTPLATGSVLLGGIASAPVKIGVGLQATGETLGTSSLGSNGPNNDASNNLTADFGFTPVYSLGDRVWFDTNQDGIQQPDERGIAGVDVNLYAADASTLLQTTQTDGSGVYRFSELPVGNYVLGFVKPAGYQFSPQNQGSGALADSFDGDADSKTGKTATVNLAGTDNPTVDAGLFFESGATAARIGDRVWYDANRDGLQSQGEPGLAGVAVNLWDGNHANLLAISISDGNGFYEFAGLPAASYVVEFTAPAGYTRTLHKAGGNDGNDSDAAVDTGLTKPVTLTAGQNLATLDAGLFLSTGNPASLGDKVWYDTNGNGIQETGEQGMPGIVVNLYDAGGTILMAQSKTDAKGAYSFGGLAAASYVVEFVQPNAMFVFSPQNQGGNGAIDSDADIFTGRVAVALAAGENQADIDVGLAITGAQAISIGDSVWLDGNGDLAFNAGEGQANAQVVLYDGFGNELVRTATSALDANYSFTGLGQGNYRVAVDKSSLPANAAQIADPGTVLDSLHDLVNQTTSTIAVDFGYSTHIDFGDLPDSYGTLLTGNGPRHAITGIQLGDIATDAEADGQVTTTATGDNANGAGPNDENSIGFSPWIKGQSANLRVSATAAGVLNAWADWNHNGTFDSGERILTDQALTAGLNTLTVAVPSNATAGQIAIRFRATDAKGQGGSNPTGLATSGEVEDYFTTVYVAGNVGSIAGQVRNDTNGDGNLSAAYLGLEGAVLTLYSDPNGDGNPADGEIVDTYTTFADGQYTFAVPTLGSYIVVESNPAGYTSTNDVLPPNNDSIAVAMPSFKAVTGRNFLDSMTPHAGSIAGQVRNDINGDGNLTASYAGLAGVTLSLYTDPNGDGNPSDGMAYASLITDDSGNYRFTNLPMGGYVAVQASRPVAVPPYFPTNDAAAPNDDSIPVKLTLASADLSGADFLNCQNPKVAPPPLDFVAIDSRPLTNLIGAQCKGSINLFKDASATDLEAYRRDNGGSLAFGININEVKEGTETALSQGISIKEAALTLTFSDGREKTYSISNGSCYTETYTLLAEVGNPTRKLQYTLLGNDETNRIGSINAIQNTYDSTLKCYVPDTLSSSTGSKVVSASLTVQGVNADVSKGDPEAFYDCSGATQTVALLNATDRRFIDQNQAGGLQAPAKAMTNPSPIPDPLAVTSWNSFPSGNTHYFVAYEDMYPKLGDYDFNDLVVAYQVQFGMNSNNQVVKIMGNAYLLAKGAAYSHDWHVRINLPAGVKTAVGCSTALAATPQTRFNCNGVTPPVASGTVDVVVFADTGKIFPSQFTDYRKVFTNTLFGAAYLKGPKSTFIINLDQPVDPANIGTAPFDPYLYVRDTKQTIQLLQFNPAIKDANGYPYAMLMPSGWNWPYEKTDIRKAYTQFNDFAATQGASSVNWYNFPAKYQFYPSPQPTVWAW